MSVPDNDFSPSPPDAPVEEPKEELCAHVFDVDGTLTSRPGQDPNSLFGTYIAIMCVKIFAVFAGTDKYTVDALIKDLSFESFFGVRWGEHLPNDTTTVFGEELVRSLGEMDISMDNYSEWSNHPLAIYLLSEDPLKWGKDGVYKWTDEHVHGDLLRKWLRKQKSAALYSVVSNSWHASVVYMLECLGIAELFNLSTNADPKTRSLGSAFRTFERFVTKSGEAEIDRVFFKSEHWLPPITSRSKGWRMMPNGEVFVPLVDQAELLGIKSVVYVDDSRDDIEDMANLARHVLNTPAEHDPLCFNLIRLFVTEAGRSTQWIGDNGVADKLDVILQKQEPSASRIVVLADTRSKDAEDHIKEIVCGHRKTRG